ncbi:hypothetical protein GCM10008955_25760 [Deinococcus malanensis]|uniref:DUF3618 domain-containing protein n=1 Tax=Deinococcus malanensis TaxID=1706855 RepID=A0ABQ2EXL6_9DEIO|nr:hypothetical protein [Deinococcus malanensis]GGK30805.1 hypothetical protein GCM10008955_25760 [Deinococcus malanensis]
MTAIHKTIESLKLKAQQNDTGAARELAAVASKALVKQQAATAAVVAEQQKDLKSLQRELSELKAARSSGGFPWGLVLVAGSAYALYRSNPAVRTQVQGLMDQAGAQSLIEKVKSPEFIAQVKSTVQSKLGGDQADDVVSGAADSLSDAIPERPLAQIEEVAHDLTSEDIASAREVGKRDAGAS